MCTEQECESLVYYGDQSRSMIDVLGLDHYLFWQARVKAFYGWYSKSGSKIDQDAWTWEGKDDKKWSTTNASPSELRAFQPIQQTVQIQMRKN